MHKGVFGTIVLIIITAIVILLHSCKTEQHYCARPLNSTYDEELSMLPDSVFVTKVNIYK